MRSNFLHTAILALAAWILLSGNVSAQTNTNIYAGRDTAICKAVSLTLASVGAYITGEVTDGTWFTSGDGRFFPSQMSTGQFSQTLSYIPGTGDIFRGYVDLTLVSFDPDGTGPKVQVNDVMRLSLITDPPMICNNNLNVSLAANCAQQINASMVISNPQGNLADYIVELYYNGVKLPNNIITREYLNKQLEFKVFYACGTNSCWGYITAQDKEAPRLACRDTIIPCDRSFLPDSIGFPLETYSTYLFLGNNTYEFNQADNCGKARLYYTDENIKLQCSEGGYNSRIVRKWEAVDDIGNKSYCTQNIFIQAKPLALLVLPKNYDDITLPAFICGSNYKKLPNGHPSPEVSGSPNAKGCTNLEYTYTDTEFPICGNSFKIVRKWLLIDWCNSTTQEHIQIIKIIDKTPPVITCPNDTIFKTTAYECHSGIQSLPIPKITDECGSTTYSVSIFDSLNRKKDQFIEVIQNSYKIVNLPIGKYTLKYYAQDACGNRDSCTSMLRLIDDQPPFPVCVEKIVINFNESDRATLYPDAIDQGSTDNCGIAKYEVAKMSDSCSNRANIFGPYVDFCCSELGTTVMVALRVTDFAGNSNTCMVEVKVSDKKAPTIICPSDITIACSYPIDFKHLEEFGTVRNSEAEVQNIVIHDEINDGVIGTDGYAIDNCTFTITEKYENNLKCQRGTVVRTFYATDASGNVDSCSQIITVIDPSPFNYEDIIWPRDTLLDMCRAEEIDTMITGRPYFKNENCSSLAIDYEDVPFDQLDGACYKIIRQWTIIDWCQYNGVNGPGLWHRDQVIKLYNAEPPTITTACQDTTWCLFSQECEDELYTKKFAATDNCTDSARLQWTWKIDVNNNGTFDISGTGSTISTLLNKGKHKVVIEVRDQCGNKTNCTYFINARDCKAPSPYCIETLGTVIMPTSGNITVWAKDFDKGSYDNCTPMSKLKFSFTPNIRDSFKTITCSDIPDGVAADIPIKMYVTDEDGNQDFCLTVLRVQDNSDLCQDINNFVNLNATITTNLGKELGNANIFYKKMPDGESKSMSIANQNFTIPDLNPGNQFMLTMEKNESAGAGMNVVDILLVQKHILVITPFKDPFQILSADVNNSGSVTVQDMVEMRKIILGQALGFSSNLPIWSFAKKDHVFENIKKPVRPDGKVYTDTIKSTGENKIDLIAYKLGNVSSIGQASNANGSTNSRSVSSIYLKESEPGKLHLDQSSYVDGFQMEIQNLHNIKDVIIHPDLKPYTFYNLAEDHSLRVIFYSDRPIFLSSDKPIIEIVGVETSIGLQPTYENIWIENDEVKSLKVEYLPDLPKSQETYEYAVSTAGDQLVIQQKVGEIKDMQVAIFDVQGKLLHKTNTTVDGTVYLDVPQLTNGIYLCSIKKGNITRTIKFVVIQ